MDIAELQIRIDGAKASVEANRLERDLNKLENTTNKTTGAFSGLAGKAKLVAVALGGAAVIKATRDWIQFGSAIADLSAITGATGEDLEYLKQQSLEIGEATTLSATQAATAFKLMASAKPDLLANAEALASVTREAVALSEASGVDLPTSAATLGSALNQFSADADEAGRYINALAAGAKYGASEVNETAQALRLSGVVAANANLSFEDTNTALQLLAKGAIKGSEAGTGLRGVILKLSTQANDDFNPAIVGMEKALQNLAEAELTATEKKKLFGQESITAAELLIKEASSFGTLKNQISDTGTAYDQQRVRNDTLQGDLKRLASITESAGLQFGEVFDPALRAVVQSASYLIKVLKTTILTIDDVGNAIGAYAAATASFLSGEITQAKEILNLRDQERVANEQKFEDIWKVSNAETQAAEEAKKLSENRRAREIEEDALAEKRRQTQLANSKLLAEQQAVEFEKEMQRTRDKGAMELEALETSLLSQEERIALSYQNRQFIIETAFQDELISDARRKELLLQLEQQYEEKRSEMAQKGADERRAIMQRSLGAAAGIFDGLTALMESSGKEQTASTRRLARLSIIASTAQAVMNALAVSPYPLGVSLAVGAALKGAAQLRNVGGTGGGTIVRPSQIGTPANTSPISPPPNADAYGPQATNKSGVTSTFNIIGKDTDTMTVGQIRDTFEKMREAMERGDEVLFSSDSRQALELAG